MQKRRSNQRKEISLMSCLAILMFWGTMVLIPLFFERNYFNMLEAKAHLLIGVALTVSLMAVIPFFTEKEYKKLRLTGMDLHDWCILAFALTAGISCLLSENVSAAFDGMTEWGMGFLAIISGTLIYFLISRYFVNLQGIWTPVIIINIFIMFIGVLEAAKTDPLNIHGGMSAIILVYDYISTIGQKNWLAAYLCLVYPLILMMFLRTKKRRDLILTLLFLAGGTAELFFCTSDSIYIGLGCCVFFLLPYVFSDRIRLYRASLILILIGSEASLIRILPCFSDILSHMTGVSLLIISHFLGIPIIVLGAAGILAAEFLYRNDSKKTGKILLIVCESLLILACLVIGFYSLKNFDDSWGSYRKLIWKTGMSYYLNSFTLKEKIIGLGPDFIRSAFAGLLISGKFPVVAAHSSFLQTLLSMGMVGAILWIAFWIVTFYKAIRIRVWKSESLIWFLPIVSFFGQSFVNTTVATSCAVFSTILGIYSASTRRSKVQPPG